MGGQICRSAGMKKPLVAVLALVLVLGAGWWGWQRVFGGGSAAPPPPRQ